MVSSKEMKALLTLATTATGAVVALLLCGDLADAFSVSRRRSTHNHLDGFRLTQQTRLFQGTAAAASPIISLDEQCDTENKLIHNKSVVSRTAVSQQQGSNRDTTSVTATATATTELVPSKWSQALRRFFLGDVGPPLVLLTISGFIYTRYQLLSTVPLSITEVTIFSLAILTWWVQEYFFHRVLLHSPHFHWIGKSIHEAHHNKDYFHISIDPPILLLGWLFAAHFIIRAMFLLPQQWNLCLSATIGYSLAGLVYEWSHYIVHTKVKPHIVPSTSTKQSLPERMIMQPLMKVYAKTRDNHIRHHLIDSRYWYAFSVTEMDDLFGTNPNVKELKREMMMKKQKADEGFQ